MPCREKRARLLLESGRLLYRYPFTIHLKDPRRGSLQPVRVKLDPGSKTTGIAVVTDADGNRPAKVLALFELARATDQRSSYGSPGVSAAAPQRESLLPGTAVC